MTDLLSALGLVLVIEGIAVAVAPGILRRAADSLSALPEPVRRAGGLAAAGLGLLLVWLIRG
jgi:uncharacterized protein YjeT (DUF2065 family)